MEYYNYVTDLIIGSAIEVHRELGPGLLESVYEECLEYELKQQKLQVKRQVPVPIVYKETPLNKTFYMDLLVEDLVPIELKAVEHLLPIHEVQLVTYLRLSGKKLGLLLNFNVEVMKHGIKRKINGYF